MAFFKFIFYFLRITGGLSQKSFNEMKKTEAKFGFRRKWRLRSRGRKRRLFHLRNLVLKRRKEKKVAIKEAYNIR